MSVRLHDGSLHPDDPDWRADANCRGMNPDLFFPDKGAPLATIRAAKAVCEECSVRRACLEDAEERGEVFGVWGGLSVLERRRLPTHRTHAQRVEAVRQRRLEALRLYESGWAAAAIAARMGRSVDAVWDDLVQARREAS